MHRGSLVVAVLSLAGGVLSLAIATALRNPLSLYLVLAFVLFANVGVRYLIARRGNRRSDRGGGHGYTAVDTTPRGWE